MHHPRPRDVGAFRNHNALKLYVVGGSVTLESVSWKLSMCNEIHSQDNPSGKPGKHFLGIFHQNRCCVLRVGFLQ